MAVVRFYGRGQDAPRQSGSDPSPVPAVGRGASKHDESRDVPGCEVVIRPHMGNDVFNRSLLIHIKPVQGFSM